MYEILVLKKMIILVVSFCVITIASSSLLTPFCLLLSQDKKVVDIKKFVKIQIS